MREQYVEHFVNGTVEKLLKGALQAEFSVIFVDVIVLGFGKILPSVLQPFPERGVFDAVVAKCFGKSISLVSESRSSIMNSRKACSAENRGKGLAKANSRSSP